MTGPAMRLNDDPLEVLKGLKQQRTPSDDPLEQLKALKANPQGGGIHAEYASGALAKRMQSANERDAQNLADYEATGEPSSTFNATGRSLLATSANLARHIPGVGLAQDAARALTRWQPIGEAKADIDKEVGKIPGPTRAFGAMLGAVPSGAILPAAWSPAAAGAFFGGAGQALSDEPINTAGDLLKRGGNTALGAGAGAIVGKVLDVGTTAAKAALSQNPQNNILARQAARAESAKNLYGAALAEGKEREVTPAIEAYVAEPEIAHRVAALQKLDEFKNVDATDPRMLDALHKSLTDEAHAIDKGLAVQDPSKPNTGRFLGRNVVSLKQRLMGAMEAPGSATIPAPETAQSPPPSLRDALDQFHSRPGIALRRREGTVAQQMARSALERHGAENIVSPPLRGAPSEQTVETPAMMPAYRDAVTDFARRSAEINAVGKGMTAAQATTKPGRPTFKQITNKEPKTAETFAQWANTASPGEIQAAREGILGDVKNAFHEPGKTLAPFRRALGKGSTLLRSAQNDNQDLTDILQRLGISAATSPLSQP